LQAATHSRICQILNVFDTGSHVCIILEYAPTDLLQYINSTRLKYLSEAESRHLFTQMMDGMCSRRARGVVSFCFE
jgi:serine/threonine protein kinase